MTSNLKRDFQVKTILVKGILIHISTADIISGSASVGIEGSGILYTPNRISGVAKMLEIIFVYKIKKALRKWDDNSVTNIKTETFIDFISISCSANMQDIGKAIPTIVQILCCHPCTESELTTAKKFLLSAIHENKESKANKLYSLLLKRILKGGLKKPEFGKQSSIKNTELKDIEKFRLKRVMPKNLKITCVIPRCSEDDINNLVNQITKGLEEIPTPTKKHTFQKKYVEIDSKSQTYIKLQSSKLDTFIRMIDISSNHLYLVNLLQAMISFVSNSISYKHLNSTADVRLISFNQKALVTIYGKCSQAEQAKSFLTGLKNSSLTAGEFKTIKKTMILDYASIMTNPEKLAQFNLAYLIRFGMWPSAPGLDHILKREAKFIQGMPLSCAVQHLQKYTSKHAGEVLVQRSYKTEIEKE